MIDTVHIRIPLNLIPGNRVEELRRTFLDRGRITKNNDTNEFFAHGEFKNFNVTLGLKSVTVNGSLSKYYFGDNVRSLSPPQINDAIKKLSAELRLPLLKGDLVRVDVAESFPVHSNAQRYFNCLLETPNYGFSKDPHGVRYSKDSLCLVFYDKSGDAQKSSDALIEYGDSVLRIEFRVLKRVKGKVMKGKRVKAVLLLSNVLKRRLATLWYQHYCNILKRAAFYELNQAKGWKDVERFLAASAINDLSLPVLLRQIDVLAHQNRWTTDSKCYVKKQCRTVYRDYRTVKSSPIKELDQLVEQSAIKCQFINLGLNNAD